MSYAPSKFLPLTKGGCFREKDTDNFFEYDTHDDFIEDWILPDFCHRVWVNSRPVNESGWRYALVKKTVAYIVIDEDEYGQPVVQKWQIKNHDKYGEQ